MLTKVRNGISLGRLEEFSHHLDWRREVVSWMGVKWEVSSNSQLNFNCQIEFFNFDCGRARI